MHLFQFKNSKILTASSICLQPLVYYLTVIFCARFRWVPPGAEAKEHHRQPEGGHPTTVTRGCPKANREHHRIQHLWDSHGAGHADYLWNVAPCSLADIEQRSEELAVSVIRACTDDTDDMGTPSLDLLDHLLVVVDGAENHRRTMRSSLVRTALKTAIFTCCVCSEDPSGILHTARRYQRSYSTPQIDC
jgi:hypothetical protein